MRSEGIDAANRELKRALRAQRRISSFESVEEAEDAWADFLTHSGRIYEKLRAACYGHPLDWKWWKKKLDVRRDDPLLLYVHKARNADTHRLESITEPVRDGKHWFQVAGYGTVHYDGPQHLRPLRVWDRKGNAYDPPVWHRGRFFGYMGVDTMSWLALLYPQDLMREASSRLR